MVWVYVWPDDGSLEEPKHVATLDATLNHLVRRIFLYSFFNYYYHILQHNGMENMKLFYTIWRLRIVCRISLRY
jgi:hypothetical protein